MSDRAIPETLVPICYLAAIGLIVSGFNEQVSPGIPIAGAIVFFTIIYAEVSRK